MPGRKRKRKATSGEYDGMSRNKKGQKSFINQWVTSSLPPNIDWLYVSKAADIQSQLQLS